VGNAANVAIVRTIPLLDDRHDECDGGKPQERGAGIAEEAAAKRGGVHGRIDRSCRGWRRPGIGGDCDSCRRHPAVRLGIVVSRRHGGAGDPDPGGDLVGGEHDGRSDVLLGHVLGMAAQASHDVHADRLVDDSPEAPGAALAGRTTATDDHEPEPDQPDDHDGGDEQSGGVQGNDPRWATHVRRAASRRDATTGRRDHSFGRST
jgi:hypothetical protein